MQTTDTIYDNVSHVNYGFHHEEQRPAPYAPPSGINPALPQYPGPQNPQYLEQNPPPPYVSERSWPAQSLHECTPRTAAVNTHHTVTPGAHRDVNPVHKASRRRKWPFILGVVITLLVVAGVIAAVLWFYGVFDCLQGCRCKTDNECVSFSQWCNGVQDCPSRDDEHHCFRLFGSNFLLQMYSNVTQKWENVCSDGWSDNLGMQVCEEMGYERNTYVGFEKISSSNLTSFLSKSSVCSSNKAAALRCIASVRPVCLPNKGMSFAAPRESYVTGWGALLSGGPSSPSLQEAKIQLIDRTTCNSRAVYAGQITDGMICAGKLEGGVDSCQGDSGGPLVTQEKSLWWLVGDTSWGDGCAVRNKPGVYGNVTYFLDWIYEQMQRY